MNKILTFLHKEKNTVTLVSNVKNVLIGNLIFCKSNILAVFPITKCYYLHMNI